MIFFIQSDKTNLFKTLLVSIFGFVLARNERWG